MMPFPRRPRPPARIHPGPGLGVPDLQERILDLEAVDGREPLTERALRDVVRHEGWVDPRPV